MSKHGADAYMLAVALALGVLGAIPTAVQSIGVAYGMNGDGLPSASDVVRLYQSNGITGMRLYFPDGNVLRALNGTNISLILDVGNDQLASLAASASNAVSWVQANVRPYYPAVNIKYIAAGNEVQGGDTNNIVPAIRNLNAALPAAGLGGIKVSTSVRFDVVANSFPPSAGVFPQSYMTDVVRLLASTGAPLLANVYPYFAYRDNPRDIQLNYATFQPGTTVRDNNGLTYTCLFDAMVDSIYAALEKAGTAGLKVVVSESGWPSASGFGATADNARTYNQGLIDHVGRGTPKRPGAALETYIFAMFNENQKLGDPTEKHFGLFNPDKSPAYAIRF